MAADQVPEEASAEMRQGARLIRDMYAALIAEGFTPNQALYMCGVALAGPPRAS